MLTWTQQKPNTPGWYWMLSPGKSSNLPTIVQIVFDSGNHRWSALVPASHYPNTSGAELDLRSIDAMWAGPLEVPSVLAKASFEMVSPKETQIDLVIPEHV
jgi:hypothetical protein